MDHEIFVEFLNGPLMGNRKQFCLIATGLHIYSFGLKS